MEDQDSQDIETDDATLYSLPPSPTLQHPTPLSVHRPQLVDLDPRLIHLPPSSASLIPPPSPNLNENKEYIPSGYAAGVQEDERICRICFAGDEEEEELGRLFAPCRCSGSMRHVHVKCLSQWRNSSSNKTAFWSCPQCKFEYRFSRTRISGLATRKDAILLTTLLTFFLLTLLTGHFLSLFLSTYLSVPTLSSPDSSSTIAEILLHQNHDPFDPYGEGTVRIRYAPSSTAFEIIRGAVGVFAGGEAGEVIVGLWEVTIGSLLGGGAGDEGVFVAAGDAQGGGIDGSCSWTDHLFRFFYTLIGIPYDLPIPPLHHPLAIHLPPLPSSSFIDWIVHRLTLGVAFVGSASFVSFLLSFSLLPIFSIFNAYHLPAFVRFGRTTRGHAGGRGARGGVGLGAIVMVLIVGAGLVRTFISLYHGLQTLSAHLLLRAETAILEVSPSGEALVVQPTLAKHSGDVYVAVDDRVEVGGLARGPGGWQ